MIKANLIVFIIFTFLSVSGQEINLEWARSIGGVNDDRGKSLAIDNQGKTYITGNFQGTVDFDPGEGEFFLTSNGQDDIYIQKMDSEGNFEWAFSIGGEGYLDRGESIIIDNEDNVYITGSFQDTLDFDPGTNVYPLASNGGTDFFVIKLDSSGNLLWAINIGGEGYEYSRYIAVDNLGGVYITGSINSFDIDFDPGEGTHYLSLTNGVVFILKLDSSGNFSWAKNMGGIGNPFYYTWGKAICFDAQQNVYLTGVYGGISDFDPGPAVSNLTSNGKSDAFILKLDAYGNYVWAKSIGGEGEDRCESIKIDSDNNLYLTGSFRSTVDFDPGPSNFELTSEGENDAFIMKLDAQGNYIWAKGLGSLGYDFSNSIFIDSYDDVYITGGFNNTVDFNPNAGVYNLTSFGTTDLFIEKLEPSGNFLWAIQMGGVSTEKGNSLAIANSGYIYVIGNYHGTADFDPNQTNYYLTSNGSVEIFVVKLENGSAKTIEIKNSNYMLYPNPSEGIIYFTNLKSISKVFVYDRSGKKIIEQNMQGNQLDLSDFPRGMYFITIMYSDNLSITEKIIIN